MGKDKKIPPKGTTTVLTAAASNSTTLRTTVPAWIIRQYGLKAGDKLSWKIVSYNRKLRLLVIPTKKGK